MQQQTKSEVAGCGPATSGMKQVGFGKDPALLQPDYSISLQICQSNYVLTLADALSLTLLDETETWVEDRIQTGRMSPEIAALYGCSQPWYSQAYKAGRDARDLDGGGDR